MAFEPILTGTLFPSPRVRVDFDAVAVGTTRARVERTAGGIVLTVRDGGNVFAAGGFTITDFEPPLGVQVSYRAEMFDSAGLSLGFTGSTVVELFGEVGWVWFSDPYDPSIAVYVQQADTFAAGIARARPAQRHSVSGRTVALYGPDGLIEGVDLAVYTMSDEVAASLRTVLASGFVLVRTMPPVAVPRLLYVFVPQRSEVGLNIRHGGQFTRWEMTGDELSPTDVGVALPPVSYQIYMDAFATYAAAMSTYSTYLDAAKNPPGGTV